MSEEIVKSSDDSLSKIDKLPWGTDNPIPFAQIIKYLKKGLNYSEIARQFGVSRQAIRERCIKEEFTIEESTAYQDEKATIFEHKQRLMINSLTPERIKKMADTTTIVGIGVLQDKIKDIRAQQPIQVEKLVFNVVYHKPVDSPKIDTSKTENVNKLCVTDTDKIDKDKVIDI